MVRIVLAGLAFLAATPFAHAQHERYELGRRLIEMERAWDAQPDAAARKRALPSLLNAVNRFFSFQFGSAGQSLDETRYLLTNEKLPSFPRRWCEAIAIVPEKRLLDRGDAILKIDLKPFYSLKGDAPKGAKISLAIGGANAELFSLDQLPKSIDLQVEASDKDRDFPLKWRYLLEGQEFPERELKLSQVRDLSKRLDALRVAKKQFKDKPTMESATLGLLLDLLESLAKKEVQETDYPAARLMAEAESLAAGLSKEEKYYSHERSGQFWLSVPNGKSEAVCRVFIPEKLDANRPVPVLFALHGMGGSENLFFDGYGDGITRKLCAERGWIMVAPRSPGFTGSPAVGVLLDELKTRYPIDEKRVFLVGHSMGAAQAVAIAQQMPEKLTAVAALGGGGGVGKEPKLKELPFFIGIGDADFALGNARSLNRALKEKGAAVELKEYANIEHMVIVREAMPDIFKFFEKATQAKK